TFTRRAESGYTAGRFFGPSWASTIDERLEIDTIGVLHITDHGQLITYPHPVPGRPVLPGTGTARHALARLDNGDYTITDPDTGRTRLYTAPPGEPGGDGTAWLAQISDRNLNTITFDRTDDGTPLALVHSAGYHLTLTTAGGHVTALALLDQGESHPVRSYGYTDWDLTSVTKPSGATLTLAYDAHHRITAWTDSNSSRYDYTYDHLHRVIAEGGEAGHFRLTLTYTDPDPDTGHRTTTLTTAEGHTTRHLIGDGCRVLATTDPLGHTTRFTHDTRGNPLTRTDPLGRTTAYAYDEEGRLAVVTRADGAELRAVRGDPSRLTEVTEVAEVIDYDGTRLRQEHDERGNRTAVTDQAGHTSRYTYNGNGHLSSITDALGAVTTVRCDRAGLLLEVSDPLGGTTRYERDAFGRTVRVTDPLGATTQLDWNADGEPARRTGPDGSVESWTHDGEGNCVSHTDASGLTTRFEYTHFDLLAARTGPDGVRYTFRHDAEARLTGVTNPAGRSWTYAYDPAGRLISETDFDGRTLTYGLDAAGRVTSRTDATGGVITFVRDLFGRVTRKEAGGAATTYAYDAAGRLVHAIGPDSELVHQYDRRGLLKTEMVNGQVTTYGYDRAGRRVHRITPTGHRTTYGYDAGGRRSHLTPGGHRITFAHDAAGRERERVYGGALTVASAWDPAGRLVAQHLSTGDRVLNRRTYGYRADGHLTAVDDALRGPSRFELDTAGHVIAVSAADWTESYAYDDLGNQTSASWPTTHPGHDATGPRVYHGTALTRAGSIRYEHDALGRITLRQKTRLSRKPDTWRYEWDAEDRLTGVVTPDGTRWRYLHDPVGRRTAKQRLATDGRTVVEETRFTWDGTTLCEQTSTGPGLPRPVSLTWDHHGPRPLAQTERILGTDTPQAVIDERFFAIATDLVGTPTELIDETGDIAWRTRTTLWGTTTWNADATTYTPLRFPGQYHDPETGLHYNYFRHYDPETARYLTPDPLGLAPAPNPIAYVHNPHSRVDPLGLAPGLCPERIEGGGWDTRGKNPLNIVPPDASVRQLTPDPNGGAQKGVEYKWTDPITGNAVRMRIHDADKTAPEGSHAYNGDIYRISIGGRYQDESGVLHHRQVHNERSPHYNPDAANSTHIPWPSEYQLPY
ncbi:polymorphic toxin type 30 domain-containing protein, partial [Streptomyces sp. NPDC001889]